MSIITSILTGGVNSHQETSETANALATDLVSSGVVGNFTATSGVAPTTGAFSINAQGTPDMTVAVGTGSAWIAATPTSQNSQKLRARNTASANVTISANASGSTKYDWLYLSVSAANAAAPNSAGDNVTTLVTSRSSNSTSDDGTPPTYGLLLAVITVANGASSITNGNIADRRVQMGLAQTTTNELVFDHVASGCVWSGDSYASTRVASMTSGVVYISGVRLTVSSVASRTFTASRDTYVDLTNSGSGTATFTYTEVTNNAASPALASGAVRIAIIVTGATTIAAAGSVNQGEEYKVLPIASSIAYTVTDSLGNLICPRDPQRKTLGYRQITADVTNTSNTAAQITGLSVPYIPPVLGRKVRVSTGARSIFNGTSGEIMTMELWEGTVGSGTELRQCIFGMAAANDFKPPYMDHTYTPTSTSVKTINLSMQRVSAGTNNYNATAASPGFVRVELA